jgi:two-component system sensor histidine kinase MprB
LSLRARLVLGTACILAAAIASGLFAAYYVVKGELRGEIDRSLVAFARPFAARASSGLKPGQLPGGKGVARVRQTGSLGGAAGYFQFVSADGTTRLPPNEHVHLPAAEARVVFAGKHTPFYSDATVNGIHLRVYTVRLTGTTALQIARPLTEVDHSLDRIGLLFLVISLVAVGGAAAVGFVVARATLRPVTRLTEDAERIAASRNLRERTDQSRSGELGRLAVAFNTMLDALTDSVRAQRQLIADASHELRTPLASARTNLEVIELHAELAPAARQRILGEAIDELKEMTQLIDELVELARGDTQAFAMSPTRLDLVTEDVGAVTARRSAVEIRLDTTPTLVAGAPEALTRAIANLLDNAVKWSPPGEPVEVSVAAGTVCVRDHGPGIEPEDLPYVFDRFYRATAARTLPGSGLGLAIVKQVAEAHGGTITALGATGGGAIFTLRLPELTAQIGPTSPARVK